MEHPVGLSPLGGFLILAAAGCAAGLLARLLLGTSAPRLLLDSALGTLGGVLLIFVLPQHGVTAGAVLGWPSTVALGAALPVAAGHGACALFRRRRR